MKRYLLLPLIILIIYFSGCIQFGVVEDFNFNSLERTCSSGENQSAEIKMDIDKITFSGVVQTPSPCYDLSASYAIERPKYQTPETEFITIYISKEDTAEGCIACVGKISFNGEILIDRYIWQQGNYGVKIMYEGKEVARMHNYAV